jgi:hypothetical protein
VAKIVLWQGSDLVTVPMSALFRRGDAWVVFIAEGGKAVLREVRLGNRNEDHAAAARWCHPNPRRDQRVRTARTSSSA